MINLIIIVISLIGVSMVFEAYLSYKAKRVKCRYIDKPLRMGK